MRSKPVQYSADAETIFKEGWVVEEDIRKSLQYGKVDFDKSNVDFEEGKLYVISGRTANNDPITIKIVNYTDKVKLLAITKP